MTIREWLCAASLCLLAALVALGGTAMAADKPIEESDKAVIAQIEKDLAQIRTDAEAAAVAGDANAVGAASNRMQAVSNSIGQLNRKYGARHPEVTRLNKLKQDTAAAVNAARQKARTAGKEEKTAARAETAKLQALDVTLPARLSEARRSIQAVSRYTAEATDEAGIKKRAALSGGDEWNLTYIAFTSARDWVYKAEGEILRLEKAFPDLADVQALRKEFDAAEASFFEKTAAIYQKVLEKSEVPRDVYKGGDKGSWKQKAVDAWKKKYPTDEILAVRFPMEAWEVTKKKQWNDATHEWITYDEESLLLALIVKKSDKIAEIHKLYPFKDHTKGTSYVSAPESRNASFWEDLLISKLAGVK